jgi:hypothetical protein
MVAFDSEKHYLGTPCKRNHLHEDTGKTPRRNSDNACIFCKAICDAEYRKRLKGQDDPISIALGVDLQRYYLGKLCPQSHDFQGTGKSLRTQHRSDCFECWRIRQQGYASKPEAQARLKAYLEVYIKSERFRNNQRRYKSSEKGRATRKRHEREYNSRPEVIEARRHYQRRDDVKEKRRLYQVEYRKTERRRHALLKYTHSEHGRANILRNTRRRRARKKQGVASGYTVAELKEHFGRFGNCCAYCGDQSEKLTLDHFIAIASGGSDCLGNAVPACQWCNASKNNRDPLIWYQSQSFFKQARWKLILKLLGKTPETYNQIPLL